MLESVLYLVLFVISIILHHMVFVFFNISILRITFYKNTPYASLCVAIVSILQVVFNGCPLTTVNNYFLSRAGFDDFETNAFWGGIFGEYTTLSRVFFMFVSLVMFYYSFKTWKKVEVPVSLERIFRKSEPQKIFKITPSPV